MEKMSNGAAGPYWIDTTGVGGRNGKDDPRMAVVPCPPGGQRLEEYMFGLKAAGVDVLVSLLEPGETRILGVDREGAVCRAAGMAFRSMPVRDHSIPESVEEFRLVVEELQHELDEGKTVAAHCYAGIGRSCMLLACVLCAEGLSPDEAFRRLSQARGLLVPDTWMQVKWVEHFAESLNRDGSK